MFEAAVSAQDPFARSACCVVVPAVGARPDPDELIDWCSQTAGKVPKAIGLLDERLAPVSARSKVRSYGRADDLTRKELS